VTGKEAVRPPRLEHGAYRITDQEFGLLRALVQQETGIQLPEAKRALLVARLSRRLRELHLDSFGAYYRRITRDGDDAERVRMIDLIATNETRFFREPQQFDFLEQWLIPAWRDQAAAGLRPRALRVWSAACASGEEPYSLAMALLSQLPDWRLAILATDLSTRALERARAAVWPIEKSRDVPERHLKAFMLRGVGANQGTMKAGPQLRGVLRFARINLHDASPTAGGPFDLILCRNVLIYFSREGRQRVVRRLLGELVSDGYLFLGHAETLHGFDEGLHGCGASIYRWAPGKVERAAVPAVDRAAGR
jgi:chemotaxis protein methyltransferase CheR